MKYSIKQASILLKQKTHCVYDDNGDIKTLKKVLKKAFPFDGTTETYKFRNKKQNYGQNSEVKEAWSDEKGYTLPNLDVIALSDIVKKIEPETLTISKYDYDLFQQFLKLYRKVKVRDL